MAQVTETRPMVVTAANQKAGGFAGIAFAILLAVVVFALPATSFSEPIADIRAFFVDNAGMVLVVGWLEAILLTFVFLFFAACLRDTLAWAETVPTELPRLTFAAGIVGAAVGAAAAVPWQALAFSEGAVDDGLLLFLMHMDVVAYTFVFAFPFALMAAAASIVILRTGALARWLGWLGVASAVLLVAGGLWIVDGSETGPLAIVEYIGFFGWIAWVLGVGVDMVRRVRAT